jgi:hypothetical protein
MPFGRPKKEGMPKTKKKKVDVVETSSTIELVLLLDVPLSSTSNKGLTNR